MSKKLDFLLYTLALFVVLTIVLPTKKITNNLQIIHSDELREEVIHKFITRSKEDPPVPYKEGTSRG
ncbi:MAG: hypothetical protein AB4080_11350 [Trichodesmium sp.]